MVSSLNYTTRMLMLGGITLRNPEFTEEQCRKELMELILNDVPAGIHFDVVANPSSVSTGFDTEAILRIIEIFDSLQIEYLIVGSIASSVHGMCRTTSNADFVAKIEKPLLPVFIEAVGKQFHMSSDVSTSVFCQSRPINLIDRRTGFHISVHHSGYRKFDRELFTNRLHVVVQPPDRRAYLASPEDTILAKLEWYESGSGVSDVQWSDIVGIVKVRSDSLNVEYMRRVAKDLNVSDLLESALIAGSCDVA